VHADPPPLETTGLEGRRAAPGDAGSSAARRTAVAIPVRALEGAKSRLGAVLDAEERRELVELLLRRTVEAACATAGVDLVAVVSPDADALAVGVEAGAEPIVQRSSGLNPGVVEAREALRGRADRLLVLPADLPGITAADISALLALADAAGLAGGAPARNLPVVVLAPDRHGRGTNALLLDPPGVIEPAFGGDSRDAHAGLAAAAGAAYVEAAGLLELDLDTPDDLLLVEAIRPELIHAH
jgi:2-phospho-L-lactate/phosphoenolpyruvate guanylyltransferase